MDDDALIRHRIKSILMDQVRASGGKRRSSSKTVKKKSSSKTAKKKSSSKKKRLLGAGIKRWIDYVKKYAKKHHLTYKQALKKAGPSYRKKYGGASSGGKKRKSSGETSRKRGSGLVKKRGSGLVRKR